MDEKVVSNIIKIFIQAILKYVSIIPNSFCCIITNIFYSMISVSVKYNEIMLTLTVNRSSLKL